MNKVTMKEGDMIHDAPCLHEWEFDNDFYTCIRCKEQFPEELMELVEGMEEGIPKHCTISILFNTWKQAQKEKNIKSEEEYIEAFGEPQTDDEKERFWFFSQRWLNNEHKSHGPFVKTVTKN